MLLRFRRLSRADRPFVEEQLEREKLIEFEQARTVLTARDQVSPLLGFAHLDQLCDFIARAGLEKYLDRLIACMGPATFGEWYQVGQIQTDDGDQIDVVHAAMMHTGWVMFIEAACGLAASRTRCGTRSIGRQLRSGCRRLLRTTFIVYGLLKGKTIAVDAATPEANAATKSF